MNFQKQVVWILLVLALVFSEWIANAQMTVPPLPLPPNDPGSEPQPPNPPTAPQLPQPPSDPGPGQQTPDPQLPNLVWKIAFESDRDLNWEIYLMEADGSYQTNLSESENYDTFAVWSPDGSQIAYQSRGDSNGTQVYVVESDGTAQTNLTGTAGGVRPRWSPNGDRILFGRSGAGLVVTDTEGNNEMVLPSGGEPRWSPDGSQIAFTRFDRGTENTHLWVMNSDGSNQMNLTENIDAFADEPRWSPLGGKISFETFRSGFDYELYVIDSDGSNLTKLIGPNWYNYWSEWSPDAEEIAFRGIGAGNRFDIFVMDADGSNVVNLTSSSFGNEFRPTWSPDGAKIAFESDRDGNWDIYLMDSDGSNLINLTNESRSRNFLPSWSPVMLPAPEPTTALLQLTALLTLLTIRRRLLKRDPLGG